MKQKITRLLNVEYSFIQGFYWMGFCVVSTFGAVFLQQRGYSNSSLGIVMALGNVLGFVLGPLLASLIDRYPKVNVFHIVPGLLAAQLAALLLLIVTPEKSFALSFAFMLYTACHVAGNGINTQLSVDLCAGGYPINYGVARGIGSGAYVLIAVATGYLVKRFTVSVLPLLGILVVFCQLASNLSIRRHSAPVYAADETVAQSREQSSSLGEFVSRNRRFCLLLLGIALIFFGHNTPNTYMINIVSSIGGDTTSVGNLNGFMAAFEIPAMFFFASFTRRLKCSNVLRFSIAVFTLKSLCIALAPNMPLLYAAHILQAFSFAVFTPAMVQYVSLTVPGKDSAKGQSLAYGMTTLGSVLASYLGGLMFDAMPVRTSLLIVAAASFAGTMICFAGTAETSSGNA